MKLGLLNAHADLVQALDHYERHLALGHQTEILDPNKSIGAGANDVIVIHNHSPEHLDGIRVARSLRENPDTSIVPIIFLSERLSASVQPVFEDLEFTWMSELPFNSGDFFRCLSDIAAYLRDHKSALSSYQEARRRLRKGAFSNALTIASELKKSSDPKFNLDLVLAEAHIGVGALDKAMQSILDYKILRPTSLAATSLEAGILLRQGQKEKYLEVLGEAMKAAEIQLSNLMHWGDTYLTRGDHEKAHEVFSEALLDADAPKAAKNGLLLADLMAGKVDLSEHGDLPQSREIARLCNLKGIAMVETGAFEEAERLYTNAIKFLPDKETVYKLWMNLALCMKKNQKWDEALHYLHKCQECAPAQYERVQAQIEFILANRGNVGTKAVQATAAPISEDEIMLEP